MLYLGLFRALKCLFMDSFHFFLKFDDFVKGIKVKGKYFTCQLDFYSHEAILRGTIKSLFFKCELNKTVS